jgi:hypothetical protein
MDGIDRARRGTAVERLKWDRLSGRATRTRSRRACGSRVPAAWAGASLFVVWLAIAADALRTAPILGWDFDLYRNAAARWLAADGFYLARQLGGPYSVQHGDVLYPPTMLYLFVPFTVLPAVLWWAIPIGLTIYAIWRLRPTPFVWPLIALCLLWPETTVKIVAGGPIMWVVAALAVGAVNGWATPFAMLKPTVAPFALLGVWRRSWWLGLALVFIASLPFLTLWAEYSRVLFDARSPAGWLYSLDEVPLMLAPLVAWVGRSAHVTEDSDASA